MPPQSDLNNIIHNEIAEDHELTDDLVRKVTDRVYQLMLRDLEFENIRLGLWNQPDYELFNDQGDP